VTVANLTEQQVLDIFSGKISNWQEVGGSDAPIVVVRREDKDSSLGNLRATFPGFKDLVFAENSTLVEKTFIMVAQIANRPASIGFGPLDVAIANGLRVLSINGKKPTDGDYPYFGTIGLVYKPANLDKLNREFIDFASSEAVHDIIVQAGGRPIK
jgi:phosphate transport system substrate-binding protein